MNCAVECSNIKKRIILFLCGCITVRLALVYLAKHVSEDTLAILGWLALIPVLGWLFIIFVRPRDTGIEVFGGKIWWKNLRIFHVMFYSLFAYFAISRKRNAYVFLLADVIFGLVSFIHHHYFT
jgi:hypothetical protein